MLDLERSARNKSQGLKEISESRRCVHNESQGTDFCVTIVSLSVFIPGVRDDLFDVVDESIGDIAVFELDDLRSPDLESFAVLIDCVFADLIFLAEVLDDCDEGESFADLVEEFRSSLEEL